jgi:demethylmenaquinone methyltransferase/2-methoxy-6-polyprenyl-1,4-benzoquinol methylase
VPEPSDVDASRHSPNDFSRELFAPLPKRYNRLANLLSMGQDPRWRREMVSHIVESRPTTVLDVACGPAAVSMQLAQRTAATIVALDLSPEMLRQGAANSHLAGLDSRISFLLGRGEQLPFADATFDALTFTYLLRYVSDPDATIHELARVVKPGGCIANLEFAVPPSPIWHLAWWGYTRWVLPVGGGLTGGRGWWDVGRFLGPNISEHYRRFSLNWTLKSWESNGIQDVHYRRMSLGGGVVIWGRRSS